MTISVVFTPPNRVDVLVDGLMLRVDVDHTIKQHIIRLAVVGDLRWRDSALLYLFNSMVPFQIEYFPAAHDVLADAWLTH